MSANDWNPRVLAFLRAHGLTEAAIARKSGEDVPRLMIDGSSNLWTVHYMVWISKRWFEWAASLGFTKGSEPHRAALREGHTPEAFDAWLLAAWGGGYVSPQSNAD